MRPRALAVALALSALLAGCTAPTQAPPADPGPAPAAAPSCDDRCDVTTAPERASEPHVALDPTDPQRILVAVNEGSELPFATPGAQGPGWSHIAVRRSSDGGRTWERVPIPYATQAPPESGWSRFCVTADPVLAWASDGAAYLSGLGWPCTNGGVPPFLVPGQPVSSVVFPSHTSVGHVWVARSDDAGATWGEPVVVFQSPGLVEWPDKEWLAVEPGTGRLFAAWVGLQREQVVLRWASSEDGGATWPGNGMFVPGSGMSFYAPAVAFGADGAVHVAYRACSGGCVEVATSGDDREWAHVKVADVTDVEVPGQRFALPALAHDAATGTLVAAWHGEGPGGDADAFFATSADGGATWSAPGTLHPETAGQQWMPALAAAGGQVHAFFFDAASGEGNLTVRPMHAVLDLATGRVDAGPAGGGMPLEEGGFFFPGDYQGAAAAPGLGAVAFAMADADGARTVRVSVFEAGGSRGA